MLKFKLRDELVNNSNIVPKHRIRNLFALPFTNISESEGVAIKSRTLDLGGSSKQAKSNTVAQKSETKTSGERTPQPKTNSIVASKRRRADSLMHQSLVWHGSAQKQKVANNLSRGWIGEISSMMLGMGQRLISGASGDKLYHSGSASEIPRLDPVDESYRPTDLAVVGKLYCAVEKSDIIRKQLTTTIYLTKSFSDEVSPQFNQ